MKDYIKSALVLVLSGVSAHAVYILLLVLNIVHYYELSNWGQILTFGYTENIVAMSAVAVLSVCLPVLTAVSGVMVRKKKEKSQLTKAENSDIIN